MKLKRFRYGLFALALFLPTQPSYAADHVDGPRASADPSADITDVFAWMSPDAKNVNLVMDLVRNATTESRFSDSVQYVFHTASQSAFGSATSSNVDVICEFKVSQEVSCWVGDKDYVSGNANNLSGLVSADGRVKVFTGLRNDPFFFNLPGFRETSRTVASAASSLSFDAAGCPALDTATSTALVSQLKQAPGGGPAQDGFANFNVLALVVVVDKALLTESGSVLSVSAATYRR
ncbi:MAG: DUF4331 family protein [Bdellovibrionota bacterium]